MNLQAIYDKLDQYKIGNTSSMLIKPDKHSAMIYAKCEWENCFGSIKDRVAVALIKDALIRQPLLSDIRSGYRIIEYSGGNLGLALAQICYDLKIPLELVLPEGLPNNFLNLLTKLHVKLHIVPAKKGFFGVMQEAKRLARQNKKLVLLYQHKNEINLRCHKNTTAKEILDDFNNKRINKVYGYVASIGTGASLIGTFLGLKKAIPNLNLYATSPAEMPYGTLKKLDKAKKFAGSGGLGYGIKQPFVLPLEKEIKQHFQFSLKECHGEMKKFYEEFGIAIGSSAAANLLAAKMIAKEAKPTDVIVTLFPSLATPEERAELELR